MELLYFYFLLAIVKTTDGKEAKLQIFGLMQYLKNPRKILDPDSNLKI